MGINRNKVAANQDGMHEDDEVVALALPDYHLSTLIDMMAISKSCMCDGGAVTNHALCESFESLEQLIYEQGFEIGGPDAVWQDPNDGSFYHPTFPEQSGEAWEALEESRKECFESRLIELMTEVLAEKDKSSGLTSSCLYEHYENLCKDIIEAHGAKGLLKAMFL